MGHKFAAACRAVKEYEREARVDGVPQAEILANKQNYVAQVNGYVRRKKDADGDVKAQLAAAAQANQASTSADAYPDGAAAVAAPSSGAAAPKQLRGMPAPSPTRKNPNTATVSEKVE